MPYLPLAASACCAAMAVVTIARKRSLPARCFAGGLMALAAERAFAFVALGSDILAAETWWKLAFVATSAVPLPWLCFSTTYSRGDYRRHLSTWRSVFVIAGLLPVAVILGGPTVSLQSVPSELSSGQAMWQPGLMTKLVSGVALISFALILVNLEQTFRAAVGTMRWRIKLVILALGLIGGTRIYLDTQLLLYSDPSVFASPTADVSLVLGCGLLVLAYRRTGWAEVDVYPSVAVLRSSITLIVVAAYLVTMGVAAQIARRFGGLEILQFQAVVVLLGAAALAAMLLSDRVRQRVDGFVSRHFVKAQHDSVRIWGLVSQRLAVPADASALSLATVRVVSEVFSALSVSLWSAEHGDEALRLEASTSLPVGDAARFESSTSPLLNDVAGLGEPCDLDELHSEWAEVLRRLNPNTFSNGGHRWCVPLRVGERVLGLLVLGDRVSGVSYTVEEVELLSCVGSQVAAVMANLSLAKEVGRARELEAFRTMSTFFVHDLKNAAASLNLILKNLPLHFDDPAFRQDALRGIGNTARRIDTMIARLSQLREQPELARTATDMNELTRAALNRLPECARASLHCELNPVPLMMADAEQIEGVITNLVLNAREAVDGGGQIQISTMCRGERVLLSVSDDGCGMTPDFMRTSLFRPFQTTKAKGLGVGLFQSRAVVEAHGGSLHVESEPGKGTTVTISVPLSEIR